MALLRIFGDKMHTILYVRHQMHFNLDGSFCSVNKLDLVLFQCKFK